MALLKPFIRDMAIMRISCFPHPLVHIHFRLLGLVRWWEMARSMLMLLSKESADSY